MERSAAEAALAIASHGGRSRSAHAQRADAGLAAVGAGGAGMLGLAAGAALVRDAVVVARAGAADRSLGVSIGGFGILAATARARTVRGTGDLHEFLLHV